MIHVQQWWYCVCFFSLVVIIIIIIIIDNMLFVSTRIRLMKYKCHLFSVTGRTAARDGSGCGQI